MEEPPSTGLPAASSSPTIARPRGAGVGVPASVRRAPRLVATVPAPGITWRGALRTAGATIPTIAMVASLILIGVNIAALCEVDPPLKRAIAVIVGAGAALVFCCGLLYVSFRPFAKVVFCSLALLLITAGFLMMVFAPVARQMNTADLAELRAFRVLMLFGALSVALGLVLGALCVRWAARPQARVRLARWSRLLGSAYGIWLGVSGIIAVLLLFGLINSEATYNRDGEFSVVERAISITAVAMMSLVPGLLLTYHGISASMGERSREFRPPYAVIGLAAFGVVLLLGHLNMTSDDPVAAFMPLLHTLGAALPGLTFAMLAARGSLLRGARPRGLSWRQWTLAVAISMTIAVPIAIYIESLGSVGGVVLLLVHHGAFEFTRNWDGVTDVIGDADFILSRNEQFVAGLITASLLAPLSEEFGKSLGVRLMMRPMTTRAQAFALGAAAGAGFGFIEAMLYGLSGVQDDLGDWWLIMTLRGGSTSLHVLCTGLTGLAWWYGRNAGRWGVASLFFGVAVALHAGWNAAFTVIDSRIFGLETLSDTAVERIAYAIVVLASTAFITAIPLVARRIRQDRPRAAVNDTPLAGMAPWLR